jgi:hypothetical protein
MFKNILSMLGRFGKAAPVTLLRFFRKKSSKSGKAGLAAGTGLLFLALSPVGKFLVASFLAVIGKAVGLIPWWLPASLFGLYAMLFG